MKTIYFLIVAFSLWLTSCSGIKDVPFTVDLWKVNLTKGSIENKDCSCCFTLCSNYVEPDVTIISDEIEVREYNHLKSYLNNICSKLEVRCDSILFYLPTQGLMVTKITEDKLWKPGALSANNMDEQTYTSWIRYDDMEVWRRKDNEIYTNIILDKRAKQLLIVDRLTYRGQDLALIRIIQTQTPKFRSIGLPSEAGTWVDVTNYTSLEPVANWIEGHRKFAFENYKIGIAQSNAIK